jgi:VanZ family protein
LEEQALNLTYVRVFRSAAWLCLVLLAALSLIPSDVQVRSGIPGGYEHAIAYFGTATMFMLCYPKRGLLIAVGLVAYGSLLETLQLIAPGRMPQVADAGASGAGALLGVLLWTVFLNYRRKDTSSRRESEPVEGY